MGEDKMQRAPDTDVSPHCVASLGKERPPRVSRRIDLTHKAARGCSSRPLNAKKRWVPRPSQLFSSQRSTLSHCRCPYGKARRRLLPIVIQHRLAAKQTTTIFFSLDCHNFLIIQIIAVPCSAPTNMASHGDPVPDLSTIADHIPRSRSTISSASSAYFHAHRHDPSTKSTSIPRTYMASPAYPPNVFGDRSANHYDGSLLSAGRTPGPSDIWNEGNGTSEMYSGTSVSRSTTHRPATVHSVRRSRGTPFPGSEGRQIICALSEARGVSPSVGVAFVNISTGEVILSKISDSQFYVKTIHKLEILEPAQMLLISSVCPPHPKSTLYDLIEEHLSDTRIIPFDRKHWSEADGLEYIRKLAFHEDAEAVKVAIQGNYYTTCALAAVSRLSTPSGFASHHFRSSSTSSPRCH